MPRVPPANGAAPWTAEDLQILAELLEEGKSMREVAGILCRSEEATRTKARLRGLLPTRPGRRAR